MTDDPLAEFNLERAIGLRWTLRDIQARRLKMSPFSDENQAVLKDLGLIEVRDEGPVLTQAGIAVLTKAARQDSSVLSGSSRRSRRARTGRSARRSSGRVVRSLPAAF